ncbi:MAG: hypothetical protein KF689_04390 [Gemmatimonadaceae bacterium]|nr:hypothetical protein [Gemmatimonadaceae bacterium]MCW5825587.1 hypothetical protein [Gemmatimonadaceae bacterium]
MSERLMLALVVALGVGAFPLPAQEATAQRDLPALHAERDRLNARWREARERLDSLRNVGRAVSDTSLVVHGAEIQFNAAALPDGERRLLRRGFELAQAELVAAFGVEAADLLAGGRWRLSVRQPDVRFVRPRALLESLGERNERRFTAPLTFPLSSAAIAKAARDHATVRLVARHPATERWLGSSISSSTDFDAHYLSHRMLVTHPSSPARRCARGVVDDCVAILDPTAWSQWYDPGDSTGSERGAIAGPLRQSVIRYAVERDGAAVFRALSSSTDSAANPVPMLARALGQSPEAFVAGWQAHIAGAGAHRARARPGTVLGVLAWSALFGFAATRRRPR